MTKPAIHVAIYLSSLRGGGAERAMLTLMQSWIEVGIRVTLLLHDERGELGHLVPAAVDILAFNTSRTAADLLPLIGFIRKTSPDILISALHHNNIVTLLAKLLTRSGTKMIPMQHNALSFEVQKGASWKYRILPPIYRLLDPLAAVSVAVSDGVAHDVAKTCKLGRARLTTIYSPVTSRDFLMRLAAPVDHPWFQEKIPVFVTAARLEEQKDYPTLLHGFALHRRQHQARLFIMGSGPLGPALIALADELGIGDDVHFAGFVENPLPYIREAAAFVLASRYEGFGIVIAEALACGTPVIATDCPFGPAEILCDGRYGCLIPVGDTAALASALGSDLRAVWSNEILKRRAEEFSLERSAQSYIALFGRVLT